MMLSVLENALSSEDIAVRLLKVSRGRFINNNYMVLNRQTGKALLIDPAWEMDRLEQALQDANAELAGILLTHSHSDHIDLASPLAEKYGCPIWLSRQEALWSGFHSPFLRIFDEGSWEVAGLPIRAIVTPGHTPGSTCYWIDQHLFTGDTLFIEGCGLCPDHDAAIRLFASIERLKAMLPGGVRLYPGHSFVQSPGLTFEQAFRYNLYLSFNSADVFANFRMRRGQNKAAWMAFS